MLFVLFHLGQERYALEAARVVEVIPLLALKRFPQSPPGVAGMFIYHGRPVPALDLCELTVGRPAHEHFSTRIILIKQASPAGEQQLMGLIAERVTDTLRCDEKDFLDPGVQLAAAPFLGPVLMDGKSVVQVICPEKLVQGDMRELVFLNPTEIVNATI